MACNKEIRSVDQTHGISQKKNFVGGVRRRERRRKKVGASSQVRISDFSVYLYFTVQVLGILG